MSCWIAFVIVVALAVALLLLWRRYRSDMRRAYQRVSGKSEIFASPYGNIEYTQGGSGPDVLVVHASGGGYDQGELMAQTGLGENFHWIAPSRFGYLRSGFPENATFDDQAHAFASLLDHLGIQKVAVVAMSHGGPSALLFALLYPERVSSLSLIFCGVAPATDVEQLEANKKGKLLVSIFKSDFTYWLVSTLFKKQFMLLMGADEAVIASLSPQQLEMVEKLMIDYMNPASLRYQGVVIDNRNELPGARIDGIHAPTLIIHAADDTIQLYRNAEFAAAHIPNARLVRYEKGGHFLIVIEQAAIRSLVQQHILDNLGE